MAKDPAVAVLKRQIQNSRSIVESEQRRIAALSQALAALTDKPIPAAASTPARSGRRRSVKRASRSKRAPRGQNREKILKAVQRGSSPTAAEVAQQTRLPKATVATAVSKLVKDGVLARDKSGGLTVLRAAAK